MYAIHHYQSKQKIYGLRFNKTGSLTTSRKLGRGCALRSERQGGKKVSGMLIHLKQGEF